MSQKAPVLSRVKLLDLHPSAGDFARDVAEGLSAPTKALSPKYFYDAHGSHLFDRITELPEYYLTRTELAIMAASMSDMAERVGPDSSVIEFGAGSGLKTRRLLAGLQTPVSYVPVEISRGHLLKAAEAIAEDFPDIEVLPVCADFTQPFELPQPARMPARNLVYFPGSTIGNFTKPQALALLKVMHTEAADGGALLIGVDLRKDRETLEKAYDDAAGVTAAFNLNLLTRINRELDGDFDLGRFRHQALWNPAEGRVDIHLISEREQTVRVGERRFHFERDEAILTEYSHKYELDEFADLAAGAGFAIEQIWTDDARLFSIQLLTRT